MTTRPEVDLTLERSQLSDIALTDLTGTAREKVDQLGWEATHQVDLTHRISVRSRLSHKAVALLLLTEQKTEKTTSGERTAREDGRVGRPSELECLLEEELGVARGPPASRGLRQSKETVE